MQILFITDLDLPPNVSPNVRKVHLPFKELQKQVSQKLGLQVALNSYYKLCDFKPMYGYLFQEHIQGVDFWGFGDIDLVFGNTGKFITEEILRDNDLITFRTEWLSGALTLFRNNEYMNTLFQKSTDWQKVVTNSKHFSFTECARQYGAIRRGVSIFDIKGEIISMTAICKKEAMDGKLRYFEKKQIKEYIDANEYVVFNQGTVSDNKGNEYLHYHYITEKGKQEFSFPKWNTIPETFFITETGFYTEQNFKYMPVIKYFRQLRGVGNGIGKKYKRLKKRLQKSGK